MVLTAKGADITLAHPICFDPSINRLISSYKNLQHSLLDIGRILGRLGLLPLQVRALVTVAHMKYN